MHFLIIRKSGAAVQQGLPAVFTLRLRGVYWSSAEGSPAALGFLNLKQCRRLMYELSIYTHTPKT